MSKLIICCAAFDVERVVTFFFPVTTLSKSTREYVVYEHHIGLYYDLKPIYYAFICNFLFTL